MACVLRAIGDEFSVDLYLENSTLTTCKVYRKDEPKSARPNGSKWVTSGINVVVSKVEMDNLTQQIEDAISFLQHNKDELKRLHQFPGVEEVTLDFAIQRRDGFTQYDYFPPELLILAGKLGIGIELSQYPAEKSL